MKCFETFEYHNSDRRLWNYLLFCIVWYVALMLQVSSVRMGQQGYWSSYRYRFPSQRLPLWLSNDSKKINSFHWIQVCCQEGHSLLLNLFLCPALLKWFFNYILGSESAKSWQIALSQWFTTREACMSCGIHRVQIRDSTTCNAIYGYCTTTENILLIL